MEGIEVIKDRDCNIKFLNTGKPEMDQLINVYNTMIDALRQERTQQEQQHFSLEKLVAISPTGIIILDYDDHIQVITLKAQTILKPPLNELMGKMLNSIHHPVVNQIKKLASGGSVTIQVTGVIRDKVRKAQFIDRGFARSFILLEELTTEILNAEKKCTAKSFA